MSNTISVDKSTFTDYIFYLTRVIYLFWSLIGLFSVHSMSFLSILLVSSIKFLLIIFKSKKVTDIYDTISSIICIGILIYIVISAF